jgi:predicted ABC-type ATPase
MNLQQYLVNESINDKGIFKACFMAGTPGAGKSYVITQIKSGSIQPKIVNSDTWTEFLKVHGNDSWDKFQDKVKILTQKQLVNYLDSILPLWVDGTSSSPPSVFRRQGILKSLGYDTAMVWVNTDLETAKRRAVEREEKIGRHVDVDFIEETYTKIAKLKTYYKGQFDLFVEVNNNDGELTDEVILSIYRKMDSFFSKPVENPIGVEKIAAMKEQKAKYLSDMSNYREGELGKLAEGWFR